MERPVELPIAGTLTADDMAARGQDWASLPVVGGSYEGGVLELRFAPEARERVERLVALERECCAFLDMRLSSDGDHVALRIAGPEGSEPIVDGFARLLPAARA